jgi:hypothetical protein
MKVRQAIELTREWGDLDGRKIPGFCGAYLVGGINAMSPDAPFPSYCDVDLHIVLRSGGKDSQENLELAYRGLILECGFKGLGEYALPEVVLANPHIAPNLVVNSILADPTGQLTEIQQMVAQEFARRKWVIARCDYEKKRAVEHLEKLRQANTPTEVITQLIWYANFLSGLIAVASLATPTHRKGLVLMQNLLQKQGRLDLHENLLDVLGYKYFSREKVAFYLQECAITFDRAIEVKRTPSFWDIKLHPHLRPYAILGAQEMIDEGYHREAMFWIEMFFAISLFAILNDAPDLEKPRFQTTFKQLLSDRGLITPREWQYHKDQADNLKNEFFNIADDIVEHNPKIIDDG